MKTIIATRLFLKSPNAEELTIDCKSQTSSIGGKSFHPVNLKDLDALEKIGYTIHRINTVIQALFIDHRSSDLIIKQESVFVDIEA